MSVSGKPGKGSWEYWAKQKEAHEGIGHTKESAIRGQGHGMGEYDGSWDTRLMDVIGYRANYKETHE
eukprot:6965223-Pyramimonas_sp.AAC.1